MKYSSLARYTVRSFGDISIVAEYERSSICIKILLSPGGFKYVFSAQDVLVLLDNNYFEGNHHSGYISFGIPRSPSNVVSSSSEL